MSEGDPTDVTFERSFTLNAILILKINHFRPIMSEFLSIFAVSAETLDLTYHLKRSADGLRTCMRSDMDVVMTLSSTN